RRCLLAGRCAGREAPSTGVLSEARVGAQHKYPRSMPGPGVRHSSVPPRAPMPGTLVGLQEHLVRPIYFTEFCPMALNATTDLIHAPEAVIATLADRDFAEHLTGLVGG